MQQRGSNNQGMQNKQRGPHLQEVHTCGVKVSPHQSTKSHPRSSSQLSFAMWGPPAPIPTSQRPQAGLTHSWERRSTSKESGQVRDQKIVHNQWTQTIATGLNTLQRLHNCTRPNRARNGGRRPKPYHTAGVLVSG
jgi:hypothetical protein